MPPNWELPAIGTREHQELDFKGELKLLPDKSPDQFEMGKDIAALANAYGGRLIVGAFEDRSCVVRYDNLSRNRAREVCDLYADAQSARLRPQVQMASQPVEHKDGYVAVICVEPSMGQAIGMKVTKAEIAGDPKVPTYAFPVRDGDDTSWKHPEELHMLMIPQLRRNIILLRQAIGTRVYIEQVTTHSSAPQAYNDQLLAVEENFNIARFQRLVVPLDQIRSVWQKDKGWCLQYLLR